MDNVGVPGELGNVLLVISFISCIFALIFHRMAVYLIYLGNRIIQSCIKRGEPDRMQDELNVVGLCDRCTAWRNLSLNYSPNKIPEVVCDKETKCLSGKYAFF